jgi:hypothetical protein
MLAHLAAETGRPQSDFSLVRFEEVTWPDGCLGLAKPGTACTQALVPGWLAVFRDSAGKEFRYRAGPGSFFLEP